MRNERLTIVLLLPVVVTALAANGAAGSTMPGFAVGAPPIPTPSGGPVSQATMIATEQNPPAAEATLGLDRPARRLIQEGLLNEGFDPGAPDGLFGPRTRGAIRRWQEARGERVTGYLNGVQAALLRAADTAPPAAEARRTVRLQAAAASAPPAPVSCDELFAADADVALDSGCSPLQQAVTTAHGDPRVPDDDGVNPTRLPALDSENSAAAAAAVGDLSEDPQSNRDGNMPAARASPAQLSPDILVDRYLLRVGRLLARNDAEAARAVMNDIALLQEQHDLVLPDSVRFRQAQVAFTAGLPEMALAYLNEYLLAAGRQGEFYREALELLDSAEDAVRRAEAEERLAAEERRRADAELLIQRESDELVRRQLEAAAQRFPRDVLRSGGPGPQMVRVPTGRFQFKRSEQSAPEWVTIERPFTISEYEVTRGEFARFAARSRYLTEAERAHEDREVCHSIVAPRGGPYNWNRSERFSRHSLSDDHAVACVTVRDAMAYAKWLSEETGSSYRLPSSAEWQYAARAGSRDAMLYLPRDRSRNDCHYGQLEVIYPGCRGRVRGTTRVGRFLPNGIGIHDMIGNVSEWVLDCARVVPGTLGPRYTTSRDGAPEDPGACALPVARGSNFLGSPYGRYLPSVVSQELLQ